MPRDILFCQFAAAFSTITVSERRKSITLTQYPTGTYNIALYNIEMMNARINLG